MIIADLYAPGDLDAFATRAVHRLRQLVPAERASYHRARWKPNHVTTIVGDGKPSLPTAGAIVARFLPEHYLARHCARQGPHLRRWISTTDVLTRDAFRRSNLYEHYYRHMGIEFQIGVVFPSPGRGFFGIVLNREMGDFGDRDRALLDLLLPHVVHGHATAARLTELQRDMAALEQGADVANVGFVFLDHEWQIRVMSPRARQWLKAYFGLWHGSAKCLPRIVHAWVAHEALAAERIVPARRPLTVAGQGGRLEVRLATGPHGATLILTETVTELPLKPLEALGLSPREAEVIKWVAEGKRNAEIATILGIASATVHHHLEHIHQKLGVETRTAAAARAREAVQQACV